MAAAPVLQRNRPAEHRAEFDGMSLMPYGDVLLGFIRVLDDKRGALCSRKS